ncbi:MAG: hypothetical protein KA003_20105 [Caldilineaceae bacterium]|nr:hypothetical protein [Caldilineaceae bacterium]
MPIFNVTGTGPLADVATTPDVWRGTGNAAFLLARSLTTLGLSATAGVRMTFVLALLLGGLGTYAWLRPRLGDRGAALAGLVYAFFPPFLAAVYIRGSLADALVIGLLPLALAGTAAYPRSKAPSAAGVTVISLLWMWRTQAGLAAFATLLVLAYALFVERNRWASLIVAVSGAAGLVSLIPLWAIRGPAPVSFGEHFVYLFQLFGTRWATAPSIPGWQDGYPFQLGFAALGMGMVAVVFWFVNQQRREMDRLLGFSLMGTGLLILLPLSVSAPWWTFTGADRLLSYPWQLLPLTAPLFAALAGSLPVVEWSLGRTPVWATLLGLVVLASFPYTTAAFTQIPPPIRPPAVFADPMGEHTFALLETNLTLFPQKATLDLSWQTLRTPDFDYTLFFQAVITDADGGDAVVGQIDLQPVAGTRPATTWQPGEILTDTLTLDLPVLGQGETLRFYYGYYDWRTGARLPVETGLRRDDKVVLYGE